MCFYTIVSPFGSYYYLLDIMCHFRYHYFIGSIILLILYLSIFFKSKKDLRIILALSITILINGYYVLPYLNLYQFNEEASKPNVKILLSNILTSNTNYKGVVNIIKKENPDIVALQEVNNIWLENIKSIKKYYPYYKEVPQSGNFGLSIYSKIPISNVKVVEWGFVPVILFETRLNKKKVKVACIHTTPPFKQVIFNNRNNQLKTLAKWAKEDNTPSIVIGDLNITVFSPIFQQFENDSSLISSRKWHGLNPSWPSFLHSFLRVPIDYILHSKDFETVNIKILEDIGSDHLPVVVELKLN